MPSSLYIEQSVRILVKEQKPPWSCMDFVTYEPDLPSLIINSRHLVDSMRHEAMPS